MNHYYCFENELRVTRLLFAAFVALFIWALLLASGMLVVFEDGSMVLTLGDLVLTGCPNPLAICFGG